MSASLADQAIRFLVERRWSMLPSTGLQKKPCVGWKAFQDSLPTVAQLREWNRKYRPERWGVVTGKLAEVVVADFDGEKGIALMKEWGINPHVRTGSGGFHCYLQHPGWRVPTLNAKSGKVSWPWPGLDIRGDGGFAVLLGSNANGPYVQLRDLVPEPFDVLPEAVRAFLRQHSEQGNAPVKPQQRAHRPAPRHRVDSERLIRKALDMAPRDGRNNAGIWLACQLRDNGYGSREAEAAMREYRSRVPSVNAKGKREAYTVSEMQASLREAYSRPARMPWERRANPGPTSTSTAPSKPAPDDAKITEDNAGAHEGNADDPGSIGIYVNHTGETLVLHTGETLPPTRYARIPLEVLNDPGLSARDVRVYGVLSCSCWQGSVAQIGNRLIAVQACCSGRLVIESLETLESRGHLRKIVEGRGKRAQYVLFSLVFGKKQRAGVEEVAWGPNGRRLVSTRKDQGQARTAQADDDIVSRPRKFQKS